MNKDLQASLYQAATLTFEELAFMFPSPVLEDESLQAQLEATACVEFRGAFTGRLVIAAYGDAMPTLAANMLGDAEPPSPQDQRDALGEIANIICGNLLPMIADPKDVFHLDAPRISESMQPLPGHANAPVAEAQVGLDVGRAELTLFLDEAPLLKEQML
jgi:hypothetical protein